MQKLDVHVDGKPWLVDQRSDSSAMWQRVKTKAQTAGRIEITRHQAKPKGGSLLLGLGGTP